jgi:hypothetical protein
MDDDYERNGITLKPWFAAKESESMENSYYVTVWGWYYDRRVIERDGLICFQVTVHSQEEHCWSCEQRVSFVKQQLAKQNIQCFWTQEPGSPSLYVTVVPPQGTSAEKYLTFILDWPLIMASSWRQAHSKQPQTKARSRKRRHIVH